MTFLLVTGCVVTLIALLAMAILRWSDQRADRLEWQQLAELQPDNPQRFSSALVDELPEPARRFFNFAILPGAPLYRVSEIEMQGRFSLGTKASPNYQSMKARQILAAPEGFVWAMRTTGGLPISGSDSGRWTRFRVLGLVPVARFGGSADHTRSAFGRYVSEAVFWSPAVLLPGSGVEWEAVSEDTTRAIFTHDDLTQAVDITVDTDGQPMAVLFQRWSNANPEKVHRLQPFGGKLSDFREVAGYRLPHHVEAGNHFGTDDYFPFFVAEVTAIRFPGSKV